MFEKFQVIWDCFNSIASNRNWIPLSSPMNLLRYRAALWLQLTGGRAGSPVPREGFIWLRSCCGFWKLLRPAALRSASQWGRWQLVATLWSRPPQPAGRHQPEAGLFKHGSPSALLLPVVLGRPRMKSSLLCHTWANLLESHSEVQWILLIL